jgi:carbamoylphosphate synthase large subunit
MSLPADAGRHVVLVGATGSATGCGVVGSLRRAWGRDVTIVAMDTHAPHLVAASRVADAFEVVPEARALDFDQRLRAIIARYNVDSYQPIHDIEIAEVAELHEAQALCALLMAPAAEVARTCLDKLRTYEWLCRAGQSTPRTALAGAPFDAPAFFLKPRCGVGSVGARHVTKSALAGIPEGEREDWIVQEACDPPEITVDGFRDAAIDVVHTICRERLEVKAGVCTKARVFHDRQLEGRAGTIARELGLKGAFCIQFMRRHEDWLVTDINPRPGAGSAMSAALGLDFVAAAFATAWGEDAQRHLRDPAREAYVVRQYSEVVTA